MMRFPRYRMFSEGIFYDEQWKKDAAESEAMEKKIKAARFALGLDDPISPSALVKDEDSRNQLLHTIMVALEVSPRAYMEYLQMLYEVEVGIRPKSQPY